MEEKEDDLNEIRVFDITEYNPDDPVDKQFINQEILRIKYATLTNKLKVAKKPKDIRNLQREIDDIKKQAEANAERIYELLDVRGRLAREEELRETNKNINKAADAGLIKRTKRK